MSADAFERGRSDEHDLQQLRAIAFAIGQESELLENQRIQMLRFVDDENGRRIERNERREKTMQRRNQVVTARALAAARRAAARRNPAASAGSAPRC